MGSALRCLRAGTGFGSNFNGLLFRRRKVLLLCKPRGVCEVISVAFIFYFFLAKFVLTVQLLVMT